MGRCDPGTWHAARRTEPSEDLAGSSGVSRPIRFCAVSASYSNWNKTLNAKTLAPQNLAFNGKTRAPIARSASHGDQTHDKGLNGPLPHDSAISEICSELRRRRESNPR